MILNAEDYFSNIGDLDLFFSRLAESIVEYIERNDFMTKKTDTETTTNISSA